MYFNYIKISNGRRKIVAKRLSKLIDYYNNNYLEENIHNDYYVNNCKSHCIGYIKNIK